MPMAFMMAMNRAMTRNAPGAWAKMAMGDMLSGSTRRLKTVPWPNSSRRMPASVRATVNPSPMPRPSMMARPGSFLLA